MFKNMSLGTIVALIFALGLVAILGIGGLVCATSYISANDTGAQYEASIKAKYLNAKQVLGGYSAKLQDAAQIPGMQTDDLVKVITASNSARYGAGGSQAMFQMLKEQNPTLDQSTYKRLMTIVESGRDDWKNLQTGILDQCASYEMLRNQFWSGLWLRLAGFPRDKDLAIYCKPITSAYSDAAYEKGQADSIKLR